MPRRISGCAREGKWFTLGSFLAHFYFFKKIGTSAAYNHVPAQRIILATVVHFFCVLNHFLVLFENLIPLHIPIFIVIVKERKTHKHTHICICVNIFGNDVRDWTIILIQVTLVC